MSKCQKQSVNRHMSKYLQCRKPNLCQHLKLSNTYLYAILANTISMCLCLSRQRDAFEELCPDVSSRGVRKMNLCNEREGSSMAFHILSLNLLTFLSKCVNSTSQMENKHFIS